MADLMPPKTSGGSRPATQPQQKLQPIKPPKEHATAQAAAESLAWNGQLTDFYVYQDAAGRDVGLVARVESGDGKVMPQARCAGATWFTGKGQGIPKPCPAYGLPELLAADPNEPVLIPEGEKKVDLLHELGFVATCTAMGAGKAKHSDLTPLRGRNIILLADNDDAGRAHVQDLAERLQAVGARSIRIAELPNLPIKGDVCDWYAEHTASGADDHQIASELQAIVDEAGRRKCIDDSDDAKPRSYAMPTISVEELAADTTTQEWLIEGWAYTGSLLLFAGQSAGGKSFVALDICMRMRHGLDFHGHEMQPGSCVYFAGEGMGGIRKRIRAWLDQNSVVPDPTRYFHFVDGVPPLPTDEGRQMIHDTIEDLTKRFGHPPAFAVIDTLSQAFGGADENDAKTVAPALKNAEEVKLKFGSTVCCIHHIAKHILPSQLTMDSIRGSGAFHGNVDAAWGLARIGTERVLKPLKQRDGADDDLKLCFDLLRVETGVFLESGAPEVSCVIRPFGTSAQTSAPDLSAFLADLLRTSALEGLTAKQAIEAVDENGLPPGRTTIYKTLKDLSETPDFKAVGKTRIRYYATEFAPDQRCEKQTSAATSANVRASESADEGKRANVRPRRPPKGGGYADGRDAENSSEATANDGQTEQAKELNVKKPAPKQKRKSKKPAAKPSIDDGLPEQPKRRGRKAKETKAAASGGGAA